MRLDKMTWACIDWGILILIVAAAPVVGVPRVYGIVGYLVVRTAVRIVLRDFQSRYHDYVFKPLVKLAWGTRRHFDKHTGPIEGLGFRRIGDYSLLPWPLCFVVRFFVAPDGRAFANISEFGEVQMFCFVSVLSDGTYVESAAYEIDKLPDRSTGMIWNAQPKATPEQLYASHVRVLADLERNEGLTPLVFEADDFAQVAQYGHRLANWWFYDRGLRKQPPPEPVLEQGVQQERLAEAVT